MSHDFDGASGVAERLRSISEEIQKTIDRILTALREERLPSQQDEDRLEELSQELARLRMEQRPPLPDPRKEVRGD